VTGVSGLPNLPNFSSSLRQRQGGARVGPRTAFGPGSGARCLAGFGLDRGMGSGYKKDILRDLSGCRAVNMVMV